jgi:hypothetical protein
MNIYVISQPSNKKYDIINSAVVVALSENKASHIAPNGTLGWDGSNDLGGVWCKAEHVIVELIGTTKSKTSKILLVSWV